MSAFMGILVRSAFWELAKHRIWAELFRDLLIFTGSYVTVVVGAFVINMFRATALLDNDRKIEIDTLSLRLELPDKAQTEHVAALLGQVGDKGKELIKFVLLDDEEVSMARMRQIRGLSHAEIYTIGNQCHEVGLLKFRSDTKDIAWQSSQYWNQSYYSVTKANREILKRLPYP